MRFILYGDTETVKQMMADLLKVETIVHLCHKENRFLSKIKRMSK
jgi:hypothetical protein